MAVAYFSQWPKLGEQDSTAISARVAEQVSAALGGGMPAGSLYHAEGPSEDGGWWVFDVWTADEAYETFSREVLGPVLATVGISGNGGTVRRLEVQWESSQMAGAPPA